MLNSKDLEQHFWNITQSIHNAIIPFFVLSRQKNSGKIIGDEMMARSRNYQDELLQALKNLEEAAAYLSAALEDSNEQVFLLAVRNVVDATTGMTELAHRTQLN